MFLLEQQTKLDIKTRMKILEKKKVICDLLYVDYVIVSDNNEMNEGILEEFDVETNLVFRILYINYIL